MTSLTLKTALLAASLITVTQPVLAQDQLSVLLPPWGTLPKELTDEFAAEQGVDLDTQTLGWDEIRTKIVTSMVAPHCDTATAVIPTHCDNNEAIGVGVGVGVIV